VRRACRAHEEEETLKHSLIVTLCVAALAGCGGKVITPGEPTPSPSSPLPPEGQAPPEGQPPAEDDTQSTTPGVAVHGEGVSLGAFQADYYNGATHVHTETVDRPTIRYPWSDLHGIPSPEFRAVWTGTIDVTQPGAFQIDSDIGWAKARLFIDGAEVPFAERLGHVFDAGPHSVRVDYENAWHTTGFNMSFTSHPRLDAATARTRIAPSMTPETQIVHVDIYEADNRYNDVVLSLRDATRPVFLVLSSYHAVRWILDNPAGVDVRGVAYGAYEPGPTVASKTLVPAYEVKDLRYESAAVSSLTGRAADRVIKTYASAEETIDGP
jgi:hypothetical protein